jgi:predicted SprT family Zn-dependent metalloprotease
MTEKEILSQYIPEAAVNQVHKSIVDHKIHFRITRSRRTKLGDYRPPLRHTNHRITINHDLNQYSFLITFIHELAHLKVYEKYKHRVAPHGKEWKQLYKELMVDYLSPEIFPNDILAVLKKSMQNSRASSTSDLKLSRTLHQYDKTNGHTRIEDLPRETIFKTQNGKQFRKGDRIRTRYKCINLDNKRIYLFHPLTPVIPVN